MGRIALAIPGFFALERAVQAVEKLKKSGGDDNLKTSWGDGGSS
jgi:hypothetical protein